MAGSHFGVCLVISHHPTSSSAEAAASLFSHQSPAPVMLLMGLFPRFRSEQTLESFRAMKRIFGALHMVELKTW